VQLGPEVLRKLALELQKLSVRPDTSFLLWASYKALGETDKAKEQQVFLQSQIAAKGGGGATVPGRKSDHCACESHDYAACANELHSRKNLSLSEYLTLGKAWFGLGQFENAGDAFAAALAGNPENVEAPYWLIRTYTALSEGCFNQLMADFPDSRRTHQLRAEIFRIQQADKDAIEEYKAAARMRPDNFEVHRALGELYLSSNSLEDAWREFERALTLNPGDARGQLLMGRWYAARRQPQQAIPYLQRALRYEPGLLEAHTVLGKAYLRTGQAPLAVAELEKARVLDRYGDVHYLLYEAYRDIGKKDLAKAALAQSQELRRKSAAEDQAKIKYATDTQ
jgi:tetratricopeptide (TPR) repeat protein